MLEEALDVEVTSVEDVGCIGKKKKQDREEIQSIKTYHTDSAN